VDKDNNKMAIKLTLNEISKKTLGSYIKKAGRDVENHIYRGVDARARDDHAGFAKHAVKAERRFGGITKATDRLTKESVEETQMSSLVDLISNRNAVDLKTALYDSLQSKVNEALDSEKTEIAQYMHNTPVLSPEDQALAESILDEAGDYEPDFDDADAPVDADAEAELVRGHRAAYLNPGELHAPAAGGRDGINASSVVASRMPAARGPVPGQQTVPSSATHVSEFRPGMKESVEPLNETAPKGHTMEAYGVKGMNNTRWRKTFKSGEHAYDWAVKNDADIHGTRDLERGEMHYETRPVKESLEHLTEKKWLQHAVNPAKAGMFNGRSVDSLESQESKLVKSGPHRKGSAANTKEHELGFAIRAKKGHGFHKEEVGFSKLKESVKARGAQDSAAVVAWIKSRLA
jgi:hypothetical protein